MITRNDWTIRSSHLKVKKDDDGNFILPPIRGWHERRRLAIAELRAELKKMRRLNPARQRRQPALLLEAIRLWEADLAAGMPEHYEEPGPRSLEAIDQVQRRWRQKKAGQDGTKTRCA